MLQVGVTAGKDDGAYAALLWGLERDVFAEEKLVRVFTRSGECRQGRGEDSERGCTTGREDNNERADRKQPLLNYGNKPGSTIKKKKWHVVSTTVITDPRSKHREKVRGR